jgi:error-prone DNA polymerase
MPETPFPKAVPHPLHAPRAGGEAAPPPRAPSGVRFVELAVTSNYTFLTGASHPEEFVHRAADLGHHAAAISDTNTLAGVVRAHVAAKERGIGLCLGSRLVLRPGPEAPGDPGAALAPARPAAPGLHVLAFPTDRPAYARLCRLLTLGKRRAPKGECHLDLHDLLEHAEGLAAVVMPPPVLDERFIETLRGLRAAFGERLSLGAARTFGPDDELRLAQIADLAAHARVPMLATADAHAHAPERRRLQDVLTCIRHGCTLAGAGLRLAPNTERHLKAPEEMARLFAAHPRAIDRTAEVADLCRGFSLDQLRHEYPTDVVPPGMTGQDRLAELTWAGAHERYSGGIPEKVRAQIEHELAIIAELDYPAYFLTCHDLVRHARSRGILCQGRGAAANSAVCFCLGITSVDPAEFQLLFERFVSRERKEPPDIDIDFEHERREEVIQYLYAKYGRDRAALTAEVITYRGRSAVREVGKALGLSLDRVDALAKALDYWGDAPDEARVREAGLDPRDPTVRDVLDLTRQLIGFPRHLSQHVGGFVITRSPLCDLVPIENAAMADRTVIEWDKDDIEAVGLLKYDVLGLGMLTCVSKCFKLIEEYWGSGEVTEWQSGKVGGTDGTDPDVQGPGGVAARDGPVAGDLPGDGEDAQERDVRPDQPDAPRLIVDPDEHGGGVWEAHPAGVHQGPPHRDGFPLRAHDRVRTRHQHGHDRARRSHRGAPQGGGPPPPVAHHVAGEEDPRGGEGPPAHAATPALNHSATLPLRHSATLPPIPRPLALHTVPWRDPSVFDMICKADTVGVFQIESRAQMSMLPRLRPRTFYDLVIEVAIVRPGPIQGNMVHPYLRRRNGEEPVTYPNPAVKAVLERTLGVPLFQEQAMALAIVAAGFTPERADQLRRAMAAWKRKGDLIYRFGQEIIAGMLERGYEREFAERCFEQIKGFSEYGFPESHAASFARIVYVSAWLKRHHPAAFAAALINSQPMGFYQPAQIVRDAQEHGVEVREVDVNFSAWDCTLEGQEKWQSDRVAERQSEKDLSPRTTPAHFATLPLCPSATSPPALRLGLRLVKSLREDEARRIEAAVLAHGPVRDLERLWRLSGVRVPTLRALAQADAFRSLGLDRQAALWHVRRLRDEDLPLFDAQWQSGGVAEWRGEEGPARRSTPAHSATLPLGHSATSSLGHPAAPHLPPISPSTAVLHDYKSTGLSLKAHPISFVRARLDEMKVVPAAALKDPARTPAGRTVSVAGVVLVRQRPGTASGIVFITLEDETAIANLIVRAHVFERHRRVARTSGVLLARGRVERQGEVVHVLVTRLSSLSELVGLDRARSRDFH